MLLLLGLRKLALFFLQQSWVQHDEGKFLRVDMPALLVLVLLVLQDGGIVARLNESW
jgi:hypothetical protein